MGYDIVGLEDGRWGIEKEHRANRKRVREAGLKGVGGGDGIRFATMGSGDGGYFEVFLQSV